MEAETYTRRALPLISQLDFVNRSYKGKETNDKILNLMARYSDNLIEIFLRRC